MNISKLFEDKYTVIFVLLLVLLVSVWVSRTCRNGKFGSWLAPSEGYGTGIIEGLTSKGGITVVPSTSAISSKTINSKYCFITGDILDEIGFQFTLTTAITAGSSNTIKISYPNGYFIPLLTSTGDVILPTGSLFNQSDNSAIESGGTIAMTPNSNAPTALNNTITYTLKSESTVPINKICKLIIKNVKLGTARAAGDDSGNDPSTIYLTTSVSSSEKVMIINSPAIASDLKDPRYPEDCRLMAQNPIIKVYPSLGLNENEPAKVSSGVKVKISFKLKNIFVPGEKMVIQIPGLTQNTDLVKLVTGIYVNSSGSNENIGGSTTYSGGTASGPAYSSLTNILYVPTITSIPANSLITLIFDALTTPASNQSEMPAQMVTLTASNQIIERGTYQFPAITGAGTSISTTLSGTASDGTTYVTSAAASVLITDVKRQSQWAINAQKDYDLAWTKLRNATSSDKDAAQTNYDNAVKLRNKLIASHPDSWFDGSAWRYGDDGFVKKCIEPSTLSSNEGNCQNIYKTDASGNLVKTADGNNVLLMKKCPWKCSNPGQSGSDACRIDADCVKVIRWATYLPDGTQIEKNLLASSTRSTYDEPTTSSSSSALNENDIYQRGITRNFNRNGTNNRNDGMNRHERGLFGGIRDAAGNLIRGIGNWIDPDDPQSNKRTNKHNAYYYEDGSPAATAYLGQYNGQSYEEESPYTIASRPTSYYYTTNYYYTDGQQVNDGKSNMPGALSSVSPYEPAINL
jgi:hypothetical protein